MKSNSNLFLTYIPTWVYALIISSTSFFRYKTDNFSYWRTIWPWNKLLELSHKEIFLDTLFPTFRPFIHVEKVAGEVCGYFCINFLNKLVWAIGIYTITYLIFNLIRKDFYKVNSQYLSLSNLAIYFFYPVYIFFAGFGAFTDVTYPLGMVLILISLFKLKIPKIEDKDHLLKEKNLVILITFIGAILIQFSRPYGLLVLILFGAIFIIFSGYKHLLAILLALIIASPYHINQFSKTGSIFLTNFSGCYLAEINKPFGYLRPGKEENGTSYLKKFEYQTKVSELCNMARNDIYQEYSKKPLVFVKNIMNPARIIKLIFPPTFVPYKNIPSPFDIRGSIYWLSTFTTISMFLIILSKFCKTLYSLPLRLIPKLLLLMIMLMPFLIDLIAHSGNEAIRHSLFLYLPLLFFSYKFKLKTNKFQF